MGEINCRVELENFVDRCLSIDNRLPDVAVRMHTMDALVDTGCVMLVLPQDVVEKLGLRIMGKVVVTYADERKEERNIAGTVTIRIGDRFMNADCVVGPPLSEALIGQIVLEELDLIADCRDRSLRVRPESPIYPCLKMK